MRKLALVALLLSSCSSNGPTTPECWEVRSDVGMGSSVPIRQSGKKLWLLTARHNLPLNTAGGLTVVDQIPHPTKDIALISVEGTARVLPLATTLPKFGDRLSAAGYQFGSLIMTSGYQGGKLGRMSCPIYYGASGGPVWNDKGQLVGINSMIGRGRTSTGSLYAVPHLGIYVLVIDLQDWINKTIK